MEGKSSYRRIVRIGNSSYVSLPKKWVEDKGLEQGGLLSVEQLDEGLLIKPVSGRDHAPVKVRLLDSATARDVISAYLSGYEVIEVTKPAKDFTESLHKLLNLLVGLEIVEESKERIVLQCFVKEGYDVRSVLSRMDTVSRSMYLDAAKGLEEGDPELLESVRSRDDRLDRLYFLAVRLIRSLAISSSLSSRERVFLVDARLAAKILEEIGDEAERMSRAKPAKGLISAAEGLAKCQEAALSSFLEARRNVQCASLLQLLKVQKTGSAWASLNRIAKLVLDITELT